MMKRRIALLTALLCASAIASHKEKVQLCIDIQKNNIKQEFFGGFYSTDFFDYGHTVSNTAGMKCVTHTFRHGPKNLTIKFAQKHFQATLFNQGCIIFPQDPSWGYVQLTSPIMRSNNSLVTYVLHVTQVETAPYIAFYVTCDVSQ